MPLPQSFDGESNVCAIAERWGIAVELAFKLVKMAGSIPVGLTIYSGLRSSAHQDQLRREGRPAADNDRSTHLACPATGADVRFTLGAANIESQSRVQFGLAATLVGLRWGGGGPVDSSSIPVDWNHLDLGPRTT